MTGDSRATVRDAFPHLDAIEDDALREGVLAAWEAAIEDNDVDDLASVAWLPPEQERLGLPEDTLVEHVREVVDGSVALAEILLERRGDRLEWSMDVLLAGALVHDVSKLYEYDAEGETDVGRLLGHPHFGVHVAAAAGLPVDVLHVVASHSHRSAVEPATVEAEIVAHVDQAAAQAIRLQAGDE